MNVGVTKDYKLKVRNLHASYTLGWSLETCLTHTLGCTMVARVALQNKLEVPRDKDEVYEREALKKSGHYVTSGVG
jgi:hypothetical protein